MSNRYDPAGTAEGSYQPGSDHQVLLNKLGITAKAAMDEIELELLAQLYDSVIPVFGRDQSIRSSDLIEWHRSWLGNVYAWAGNLRSVNISKGGFHFAAAAQIPRLLGELDSNYLGKVTPCTGLDEHQLAEALALVHVELLLIHPFRDGNGRLSRLLANVMTVQSGMPELDFSAWDADKSKYFAAIQAGMERDYEPMQKLFRQVLQSVSSRP